MTKPHGGGTEYSEEEKQEILDLISGGSSLNEIEKIDGMPSRKTVQRWNQNDEVWSRKYRQACADRAANFRENARKMNLKLMNRVFDDDGQTTLSSVQIAAIKQVSEYSKWECDIHSHIPTRTKNKEKESKLSYHEKHKLYTEEYRNGEINTEQYKALVGGLGNYEQVKLIEEVEKLIKHKETNKEK